MRLKRAVVLLLFAMWAGLYAPEGFFGEWHEMQPPEGGRLHRLVTNLPHTLAPFEEPPAGQHLHSSSSARRKKPTVSAAPILQDEPISVFGLGTQLGRVKNGNVLRGLSLHASLLPPGPVADTMQRLKDQQEIEEELTDCRMLLSQSAQRLSDKKASAFLQTKTQYDEAESIFAKSLEDNRVGNLSTQEVEQAASCVQIIQRSLMSQFGRLIFHDFLWQALAQATRHLSHLHMMVSLAILNQTNAILKKRRDDKKRHIDDEKDGSSKKAKRKKNNNSNSDSAT